MKYGKSSNENNQARLSAMARREYRTLDYGSEESGAGFERILSWGAVVELSCSGQWTGDIYSPGGHGSCGAESDGWCAG